MRRGREEEVPLLIGSRWCRGIVLTTVIVVLMSGCSEGKARIPTDAEQTKIETEAKDAYRLRDQPGKEVKDVMFLDPDRLDEYGLPQKTLETLEITLEKNKDLYKAVTVVEITRADGEKFYSVWHVGEDGAWEPP